MTRFYTFKRNVRLLPGQVLHFLTGKGYFAFGTPTPKPGPVTMYDATNVGVLPKDAAAVAGYVGGHWPTFASLARLFPNAHRLSIAVNDTQDADVLDIEKGDATNAQAAAWLKRQKARGSKRPGVYTSVSNAPALIQLLHAAGIGRTQFRLWTAHYTGRPHLCTSACWVGFSGQADATQYQGDITGRRPDVSLCSPGFFTDV